MRSRQSPPLEMDDRMIQNASSLLQVIDAFAGIRVAVIGEAMLDAYLRGTSDRLCQEAPVPVVAIKECNYVPGGAANTAVNLRSLGAQVDFLSVVGEDTEGKRLLEALRTRKISTQNILCASNRITLAKQRILSGSQVVVRFDQGSTSPIEPEVERKLIERLGDIFSACDVLVISDYGYGILTPNVIRALEEMQREHPCLIMVDAKDPILYRNINITAIKPNYMQALQLLGLKKEQSHAARIQQIESHGRQVLDLTNAQVAAITLDHSGALIFHRDHEKPYRTYAEPRPDSHAAGAGDTFMSVLALSLASGAQVEQAAELASAASSVVVNKNGTATCSLEELKDCFSTNEKVISDTLQLAMRLTSYRKNGQRIVFTNGCFDILHRGHITLLNQAKAQGDVLIVGVNSDESVKRLKGPTRPINPLEDRTQVLAALSCVDHIISFDDATPMDLIRAIKPDIFVKGGDYTRESLPEAGLVDELGGRVEILPYLLDHSTTSVIEKIRNLFAAKPAKLNNP